MLDIGVKAPDFKAPDQNNKLHRLSDYQGKYLLLYFYPKDNTPGCSREACTFRDSYQDFEKMGAKVLGVSKDSVVSHDRFAQKFKLSFPILADPEKVILTDYDISGRQSYLISPAGIIIKTYKNVKPDSHAHEVLTYLKGLGDNL